MKADLYGAWSFIWVVLVSHCLEGLVCGAEHMRTFFLGKDDLKPVVWMDHILFCSSWTSELLPPLTIQKAAVNEFMQISFKVLTFNSFEYLRLDHLGRIFALKEQIL